MSKRLIIVLVLLLLLVLSSIISLIIYYVKNHNNYAESSSIRQFLAAEFSKIEDVKQSQQYKYLSCLYTDDQLQNRLPFSMSDFWVIQTNLLPAGVIVGKVPKSPTAYHTCSQI
jgi:ABC-type bacteriocin/lantibiotic exporter with double-glycine peptidase domain